MDTTKKRFFIQEIDTNRKVSNERILIRLGEKNLIITGDNGCGKTKLLEGLYASLKTLIISTGDNSLESLEKKALKYERDFKNSRPGDNLYDFHKKRLNITRLEIDTLKSIKIKINNSEKFKERFHTKNAFVKYFGARREYLTDNERKITSVSSLISEYDHISVEKNDEMVQVFFENYVSSLVNFGMLHKASGNKIESERVESWFKKINLDLKTLFEDDSFEISFDIDNLSLMIHQKNKDPYSLNQLSSGYSSILAVYAELLMCVELNKLPMQDLEGIVLIDEIDAHLHVSLQKVIFAFFRKAFPKIQFIITTHSPFVVQSVNDAIIYDLSKLEQLNDLSMYSYESITKGLMGESSDSEILESTLKELEAALITSSNDKIRLKNALDKMLPYRNKMHSKARAFYNVGVNRLLEIESEDEGE